MPTFTASPSTRMIVILIRPSMTMLSPDLRERMSMEPLWKSGSGFGQRQQMLDIVFGGVCQHDLFADISIAIDDDRSFEVHRGSAAIVQGDDIKQQSVIGVFDPKELDIGLGQVGLVIG